MHMIVFFLYVHHQSIQRMKDIRRVIVKYASG